MIELDGSHGEGGGALVRVALALSTLTGQEFKVNKIRSGRPKPGLKAQHLTAIKALKEISNAETSEIKLGSTELHFKPGKIKSGTYHIDIETAGSITLLLQALILPSMFAPSKITLNIKGGTSGKWQASVDYLQNVLIPHLRKFVEKIELKILKRGYYPKGGGLISLEVSPNLKLKDYNNFQGLLEELQIKVPNIGLNKQGQLEQIRGNVNVSEQLTEKQVAERIKNSAENCLKNYQVPINIQIDYAKASSIGGEIILWAIFSEQGEINFTNPTILSGDALVDKKKSSEEIGREAAEELKQEIETGASVDNHLADQLIPFLGLLPGSSINTSEISKHTKTNIYVVEKFLPVGFKLNDKEIRVGKR